MSHFNKEFLSFFKELSKNNSTDWFNENRKTYEKEVKKPFAAFVEEMIRRIGKYEEIGIKASDAIMRINKDIRFSKDKTPYNTHVGANISPYGKKDKSYPGFYFQLSPDGVAVYGGVYMVDNPGLEKVRAYIGSHLKDFAAAYSDADFKAKYGKIQGEQNKRLSAELQALAAKEPLIANKQFFYSAELPADLITSDKLPDKLMEYYLAAKKLSSFLRKAITS